MQLVKSQFSLKGIAKQLIDMSIGELILLNNRKSIAESEMRHPRKIEGVLIQSRYVCTMWQRIISLALTNNQWSEARHRVHSMQFRQTELPSFRCMFSTSSMYSTIG